MKKQMIKVKKMKLKFKIMIRINKIVFHKQIYFNNNNYKTIKIKLMKILINIWKILIIFQNKMKRN